MDINSDSVFLMGDLNDRCTEWDTIHTDSELKQDLVDMTASFGLHQMINEPTYLTRTSANILDLIFTDSPGSITETGTLPPIGTSHHAVVYCCSSRTRSYEKPYTVEMWKYEDGDIEGLNNAICDFPFEDILGDIEDIDYAAESWTHLLIQIAKEYIPSHTVKIHPNDKPWINKDIKKTIRTRDRLYKRYLRTRNSEHFDTYIRVKAELNTKIQLQKQEHKNKMVAKLENLQHNPRSFWNVAKEIYGNKVKSTIPTLLDNGKQHSTAEQKANLLADYYASQSQRPNLPQDYVPQTSVNIPGIGNIPITEDEVHKVLKNLQIDKATGPDGVSNRLLKLTARSITSSLTMLFNKIVTTGTFPRLWKEANVTPIYKKGDRQNKKNYRPVSLLSTVGKTLERIIFNKMYSYCESNGHLTWRNSGYRKRDSTINQLTYIVNNIYKSLDNNEDNCLVFLDQSRAFDRIFHDGLKLKLSGIGINGALYNLLSSYLDNRRIRVVLNGQKSRWFKITAGVPQGSILGPLLFLIYIADIVEHLESEIYLYADDAVLTTSFAQGDADQAFEQLNRDLQRLSDWASNSFMVFNPDKTKYMVVSKAPRETLYPLLYLNGISLEKVHNYPQLGLHLNDRMNWDEHINHVINKASKKIGVIWKLSREIPRFAVENIYTTFIRPQLEYGGVIYNNCTAEQSERLEAFQRRAAIACTRSFNRTSTVELLQELGWPTLISRRQYFSLVQFYKMGKGLTPQYLQSILPPRAGSYSRYPTRQAANFIPVRTKRAKYYKFFLPATTRKWNILDDAIKELPTLGHFKNALKKSMFPKKVKLYSQFKGSASINHTRMRLGLSHLKEQLYSYHIIDSPFCPNICCDRQPESAEHYLLECPHYAASREQMFGVVGPTADELGINKSIDLVNLLLRGHSGISLGDNKTLFTFVQQYIKNTQRF